MGNSVSTTNLKCGLCTVPIPKGKFVYYDLFCSKCKSRCKSYFHNNCNSTYQKKKINDTFICHTCNNISENCPNELSEPLL